MGKYVLKERKLSDVRGIIFTKLKASNALLGVARCRRQLQNVQIWFKIVNFCQQIWNQFEQ